MPRETAARPTPDRVRETLFNWLAAALPGARCLDLFAGTGVLGLEALSRGAQEAWFVECDPLLAGSLRRHVEGLAANATVICDDVAKFLGSDRRRRFDIVFLDPPYDTPLEPSLQRLPQWLSSTAYLYVERARGPGAAGMDTVAAALPGASVLRSSHAGRVDYALLGFEE